MSDPHFTKMIQQIVSDPADLARENSLSSIIIDAVREPLVLLDKKIRVVGASRSFHQLFGLPASQTEGRSFYELNGGEWNLPVLRDLFREAIATSHVIEAFEFEHEFASIGRRVMLLNTQHVADSRNPDAALLLAFEDITLRRETEAFRDELLRQKETLLLEIQHRVANSLQIIASILMLKIGSVKSDETRLHLKDAHQRVMAVATVQEQLRQSVLGDMIEIGPYLSRLCESLAVSMIPEERELTLSAFSSGGSVKSTEAVSFGLLVTELVINAIKHAFPDGRKGKIDVRFVGKADGWRLSVSDDGIGRDTSRKEHIGLGTSIVQALSQQLKARVETFSSSPGTLVTITRT